MKTTLVIFGISGDLSTRKLLPALADIVADDPAMDLSVLGVSRREIDIAELVVGATSSPALAKRTSLFTMDLEDVSQYAALKEALGAQNADQILMYLSVPPGAAAQIVDLLGEAGLNAPNVRLLFEKPFGFDLESASDFLERTARFFDESQLYRIDHYMAKEIAAEIIRLRSNAENHHHHWNNESIASIEVIASESIGIEGRSAFYEQTGALRDFIQGHLMQLLSLVLMPLTDTYSETQLPEARLRALEALMPADPAQTIKAQYTGYQQEADNIGSQTETFVRVPLQSADPLWQGVALSLTTGKALNEKRSYIQITYRDGSIDTFEEGKIVPTESRALDAYERVLLQAVAGRKAIFTSGPEVLRSWEILNPIQQHWNMDETEIQQYAPGSTIDSVIQA